MQSPAIFLRILHTSVSCAPRQRSAQPSMADNRQRLLSSACQDMALAASLCGSCG